MTRPDWTWAYLSPPWWVTMGHAPRGAAQRQARVPFHVPFGTCPSPPAGSEVIGVRGVAIGPPAVLTTPGDFLSVSVSLTGPSTADTALWAIIYEAVDDATLAPADQSAFVIPPINVPAGSTTTAFQVKYQNLSSPGQYLVSIITAAAASQFADLARLPVTAFAPFVVQTTPIAPPPISKQNVEVAAVAISPTTVTTRGDTMAVAVSLTGPSPTDTNLYAVFYQALDNATYSPIDQTVFSFPPTSVPAGATTSGFQVTYQKLFSPGNYALSVVTGDDASQVADITDLPVRTFAPFTIGTGDGGDGTPPTTVAPTLVIAGTTLRNLVGTGGTPVAGVSVSACQVEGGAETTLATAFTDAAGNFSLPVPSSPFDGYLRLIEPGSIPATLYVSEPLASDIQLGAIFLCSPMSLDLIMSALGVPANANQATVIVSVRDSSLAGIEGVTVALEQDASSVGMLFGSETSLPSSLGTSGESTWAFDVPSGQTDIAATASGVTFAQAQVAVVPNEMTFVLVIADHVAPQQTPPQTPPPPSSPSWRQDIAVGAQPTSLAFDGTSIWVSSGSGTVSKVLASDGSKEGMFPVRGGPWTAVCVWPDVWVGSADQASGHGYLTALDPLGDISRTFVIPQQPLALIAVQYDDLQEPVLYFVAAESENLFRFDPATGGTTVIAQFGSPGGEGPQEMMFDGTNIWISDWSTNQVVKMDRYGVLQARSPVISMPLGLAFDGTNVWAANYGDTKVFKLAGTDAQTLQTIEIGVSPSFLAFDGANIWAASDTGALTLIRASDGTVVGSYPAASAVSSLLFDGASMWVANFSVNSISRIDPRVLG